MNNYLIPANSKKSLLRFGLFNNTDLFIFSGGLIATLILMLVLEVGEVVFAIISIIPLAVCSFLVIPVPNYHNIRTILGEIIDFYSNRQSFVWKGWCYLDGEDGKK